ncbi:hypothetical protein NDU88_000867, partial [Pleurodeles waltl]
MAYYANEEEQYGELQEDTSEHLLEERLVEALGYHVQDSVNWALIQALKPFTQPLSNFARREFLECEMRARRQTVLLLRLRSETLGDPEYKVDMMVGLQGFFDTNYNTAQTRGVERGTLKIVVWGESFSKSYGIRRKLEEELRQQEDTVVRFQCLGLTSGFYFEERPSAALRLLELRGIAAPPPVRVRAMSTRCFPVPLDPKTLYRYPAPQIIAFMVPVPYIITSASVPLVTKDQPAIK